MATRGIKQQASTSPGIVVDKGSNNGLHKTMRGYDEADEVCGPPTGGSSLRYDSTSVCSPNEIAACFSSSYWSY